MDKKMVEDLSNALPVLDEILNEWDEHWALTMHSNSMCREPFEEMFITVFWEKLNGRFDASSFREVMEHSYSLYQVRDQLLCKILAGLDNEGTAEEMTKEQFASYRHEHFLKKLTQRDPPTEEQKQRAREFLQRG